MKNFITIALLAAAVPAAAMQNIKLGPVDLNPVASVKQSYDSNIYLKPTDRKSSLINRSGAGVNAAVNLGSRVELKAGYLLEALGYSRTPSINNAVHHSANLAVEAKLPRDSKLAFRNDFADTTDQATSELTERAKRIQNTAAVNLESPLKGNFGYGVNVQHTYHNYKDLANKGLDRAELLAGFDISYKLQPKTKVFVGYTYGDLRYEEENTTTNTRANDATYNNIDLGISGQLAPKLTGLVKAGVQMRNYDKDLGTADNKLNTAAYSAQVQWKPLERMDVVYYGKRANVESVYVNSRFYTSTLNDVSVNREMGKFKVGVGGSYESLHYPEVTPATGEKRVDENVTARLNVDYSVQKWLKAGFNYTYKNRASNEDNVEYKDNVVGFEIKGMF